MAKVQHIQMRNDKILVTFEITDEEYKVIKLRGKRVLIAPIDMLDELLTTGKLGNSNRIMLPTKILSKYNIKKLIKRAPSKVFETFDGKYLIVELEKGGLHAPFFGGGEPNE